MRLLAVKPLIWHQEIMAVVVRPCVTMAALGSPVLQAEPGKYVSNQSRKSVHMVAD